jgi:hypothetical protein
MGSTKKGTGYWCIHFIPTQSCSRADLHRQNLFLHVSLEYIGFGFWFALANLAVAEETNPVVARRELAEADYQTSHAMKLDPDNDEVRKLRDGVVKAQNIDKKITQDNFQIHTLKAEALHLADRTSDALEAIIEVEALIESFENRYWCAELHRLKGVFFATLGADEARIEASFRAAIKHRTGAEVGFARKTRGSHLRGIPSP